jgi:hypothetical protein
MDAVDSGDGNGGLFARQYAHLDQTHDGVSEAL